MGNIFFTSDTHFSHANCLKFLRADGVTPMRSFSSLEEMDETMIENWNRVVTPQDKVYHLGDVALGPKDRFHEIMSRLNGKKRLILGNHDELVDLQMWKYFKKISMWRIFKDFNFVCSHVPLREHDLRKVEFNVHGHIHEKDSPTWQHMNICVERTNYTPLCVDEIVLELKSR